MGLFSGVSKTFKKIGKQTQQNAVNFASLPAKYSAKVISNQFASAGQVLGAAAPVLGQATGIIQDNPALANLAGSAFGMPGLGGLFGGAPAPVEPMSGAFSAPPPAAGVPVWVWIAAAGAAVLGLVLFLRRKS